MRPLAPLVSVIVSTYNRPSSLLLSVLSLARQDPLPHEVVIADDGSGRETADMVARLRAEMPFPVRHAWQEDRGFRLAAARNTGVRASSGSYLLFLDGDLLAGNGLIAAHLRFAAPATFLLGSAIRLDKESSLLLTEQAVMTGAFEAMVSQREIARLSAIHRRNRRHALLRRLRLCKSHKPKLAGGHFSLFRSDFEAVNGFDESFVGWGQEDDDLGRRLMMARKRPRSIVPFAPAYHIYHPSLPRGQWGAGPNAWRLLRRHVVPFCENGLVQGEQERAS